MEKAKVTYTKDAAPPTLGDRSTERYPPDFIRVKFKGKWYELKNLELFRVYIRLCHMVNALEER